MISECLPQAKTKVQWQPSAFRKSIRNYPAPPMMAKLPLHVVFHQDIRLMVFRPRGILGEERVNTIVEFLEKEEVRAAKPFDRFCDLSKLDAIDLDFRFVFRIALYRRLVYAERAGVGAFERTLRIGESPFASLSIQAIL